MADDAQIRLANFKALFAEPFSPVEAARQLWGTPAFWSNLYHGRKAFGEKLARKIEERLGLARLSLDDPGGAAPAPLSPELMLRLQAATDDERTRLENMLRANFGMPLLSSAPNGAPGKRHRRAA